MKVKIIFDRHTHDFFLGENGKNTLCLFTICHHHHMYSVTEPNTCCSKWSGNVTFSHRFPVFSTWGVAHRGLWTTSQWSPMPFPTANRSTRHPGRSKMGGRREHVNIDTTTCDPIISMSKEKISLKMRVFQKKQKIARIGPLTQKGLIWREFCPLTVAKVQKGGFHGCQRLSKSRLRAMTAIR